MAESLPVSVGESLPVSVAVSPESILLNRLREGPPAGEEVLAQVGVSLPEGVSSTVVGLAVGLGLSTVVILGFVGFGYLLYRVSR